MKYDRRWIKTEVIPFALMLVLLTAARSSVADHYFVPQGKVLAMGDHRGNSLDGRYFGFVNETELYGRAVAVYYRSGEDFMWKEL